MSVLVAFSKIDVYLQFLLLVFFVLIGIDCVKKIDSTGSFLFLAQPTAVSYVFIPFWLVFVTRAHLGRLTVSSGKYVSPKV